jgi:hypothetical protein
MFIACINREKNENLRNISSFFAKKLPFFVPFAQDCGFIGV